VIVVVPEMLPEVAVIVTTSPAVAVVLTLTTPEELMGTFVVSLELQLGVIVFVVPFA
jgi:hypothetical protein